MNALCLGSPDAWNRPGNECVEQSASEIREIRGLRGKEIAEKDRDETPAPARLSPKRNTYHCLLLDG
jgi:hypothetical protein